MIGREKKDEAEITRIISEVDKTGADIVDVTSKARKDIRRVNSALRNIRNSFDDVAGFVKQTSADNNESVQKIQGEIQTASGQLQTMFAQGKSIVEQLNETGVRLANDGGKDIAVTMNR